MRDYLLYVLSSKGKSEAELFGENRLYDVAINDHTESHTYPEEAEYKFSVNKWKFKHVNEDLQDLILKYKACAFFDDDVKVSTNDLNRLFLIGDCLNLNIWHPSLTADSYIYWQHLKQQPDSLIRPTNTVDLMAPIFSREALKICMDSFSFNYSGWGLEIVWFHLMQPNPKHATIDAVPVIHTRPVRGGARIMPNGKTPTEECNEMLHALKLKHPKIHY